MFILVSMLRPVIPLSDWRLALDYVPDMINPWPFITSKNELGESTPGCYLSTNYL